MDKGRRSTDPAEEGMANKKHSAPPFQYQLYPTPSIPTTSLPTPVRPPSIVSPSLRRPSTLPSSPRPPSKREVGQRARREREKEVAARNKRKYISNRSFAQRARREREKHGLEVKNNRPSSLHTTTPNILSPILETPTLNMEQSDSLPRSGDDKGKQPMDPAEEGMAKKKHSAQLLQYLLYHVPFSRPSLPAPSLRAPSLLTSLCTISTPSTSLPTPLRPPSIVPPSLQRPSSLPSSLRSPFFPTSLRTTSIPTTSLPTPLRPPIIRRFSTLPPSLRPPSLQTSLHVPSTSIPSIPTTSLPTQLRPPSIVPPLRRPSSSPSSLRPPSKCAIIRCAQSERVKEPGTRLNKEKYVSERALGQSPRREREKQGLEVENNFPSSLHTIQLEILAPILETSTLNMEQSDSFPHPRDESVGKEKYHDSWWPWLEYTC